MLQLVLRLFLRTAEQSDRRGDQLLLRQINVAVLIHIIRKNEAQACGNTLRAILLHTEIARNHVRLVKSDAGNVGAKHIGIFLDHVDRADTPFTKDFHRHRGRKIVTAKEHDAAHTELRAKGLADLSCLSGRNAGNIREPFGVIFQYVQRIVAVLRDDLLCGRRTDSLDRARRKILQYQICRGRQFFLIIFDLELRAEGRMRRPVTERRNGFTLAKIGHRSHEDKKLIGRCQQFADRISVFLVLIDDLFNRAFDRQQFFFRSLIHEHPPS